MNPLNSGEKYQSIFSKMEKTKKSSNRGSFYQESLVEVAQVLTKKKAKREKDEQVSSAPKNEDHFEKVEIEIIDQKAVEKMGAFTVVQKVLQWIFLKDFTNPLWVLVNNKHLVQNVVFLVVNGANAEQAEANISKEKTPFLEKHFNSPAKCIMRDTPFFSPDNERFWELFFSSKHSNDLNGLGNKKKQKKQKNEDPEKPLSYEETLLEKYTNNILTKDELQMNLYPQENLPIYEDFLNTSSYKPSTQQSIKDLIIGLDCEMVRTSTGMELARLTLINFENEVIYDEFIKPENHIEDYLTKYSGITVEHMNNATKNLKDAQQDFLKFCNADTFLVGHSLENDLQCLNIIHEKVIDTSVLYLNSKGYKSSLKNLSHNYLHIDIQKGSHDSAEDAKAALALAKFKIEILDNFDSFIEKKRTAQLDILENIFAAQKTLLPLDESPYINPLLKYAIFYDEVKSRGFEEITAKILKWLRMKASGVSKPPTIMAGVIKAEEKMETEEQDESFFVKLDKRCQEIAEKCDKNTVFLMVFCDSKESNLPKKVDETQVKRAQSLGLFFVPNA